MLSRPPAGSVVVSADRQQSNIVFLRRTAKSSKSRVLSFWEAAGNIGGKCRNSAGGVKVRKRWERGIKSVTDAVWPLLLSVDTASPNYAATPTHSGQDWKTTIDKNCQQGSKICPAHTFEFIKAKSKCNASENNLNISDHPGRDCWPRVYRLVTVAAVVSCVHRSRQLTRHSRPYQLSAPSSFT